MRALFASWTPVDWRRMLGVLSLCGGGISVTILAGWALKLMAERSKDPWAVAYFGYGCLVLIGIVLTGFSAILGRRTFKMKVAGGTIESIGEDAAGRIEDALGKDPS